MQTDTDFGLFYRKRVHGETRGGELPPALSAAGTWCVVHGGSWKGGAGCVGRAARQGAGQEARRGGRRGGNTGCQPSRPPGRGAGGLARLSGSGWGSYTAREAAGPWLRSQSLTHSTGGAKARRPEGSARPSVAGARPALEEWNRPRVSRLPWQGAGAGCSVPAALRWPGPRRRRRRMRSRGGVPAPSGCLC